MANPWDHELTQSIPSLAVTPHLRVHTITHLKLRGCDGDVAVELEDTAMHAAMGKIKVYMTLVQELMLHPLVLAADFAKYCRTADQTQVELSSINVHRNRLEGQLINAKFKCPEVPETDDSSLKCPECNTTELQVEGRQTRGADEGLTIFYHCMNPKCGIEFR
jgi:DNA-directed RNA polymerase subunit M/transcription elongation factor TFIIS